MLGVRLVTERCSRHCWPFHYEILLSRGNLRRSPIFISPSGMSPPSKVGFSPPLLQNVSFHQSLKSVSVYRHLLWSSYLWNIMFLGYRMMRNMFHLERTRRECNVAADVGRECAADVSLGECVCVPPQGTITSSNNLTSRFLFKRIN